MRLKRSITTLVIFAFFFSSSITEAAIPMHPIIAPGSTRISVLSQMTLKEWSALVSKPLDPLEKMGISVLRHKMKVTLRKKGDMTFNEFMSSRKRMKTWVKVVLIVLGAFLVAFIIFGLAYGGVL